MKKLFIIRGFKLGTTAADPDFKEFRSALEATGYQVIGVPYKWNHTTMSQYCDKFVDFYNENKGVENIILGHSFGAMVALNTAAQTMPDLVVLCSLSAYFKEDLKKYPKSDWIIRHLGVKRTKDMQNISALSSATRMRDNSIKSVMIYGEKEKKLFPHLYNRVQGTAAIIKPDQLIAAPDADHTIRGKSYTDTVVSVLKEFA